MSDDVTAIGSGLNVVTSRPNSIVLDFAMLMTIHTTLA